MNRSGADVAPQVRAAREGDQARIAELSVQLGYPSGLEAIHRRLGPILSDARHALLVAELPDVPVAGWLHVFLYQVVESDLRAEIAGLVVDTAYRRRGVGRALMRRAEEWARERGCSAVSLRSNVIRKEAHAFYQGLGYTLLKTQHAFRKNL